MLVRIKSGGRSEPENWRQKNQSPKVRQQKTPQNKEAHFFHWNVAWQSYRHQTVPNARFCMRPNTGIGF